MKIRNALLATACMASAASIGCYAYAQTSNIDLQAQEAARMAVPNTIDSPHRHSGMYIVNPPPYRGPPVHHMLYVALPGDGGADGQSGIVVLDVDHDYRFVKRIPWGIPTGDLPGSEATGITASVPLNMIFVAFRDHLIGMDLKTDKVLWSFGGEPGLVRYFKSASGTGCCERPWTLPDGKTLLVGSGYMGWWYYVDAATGKILGKIVTPDSPIAHNMAVTADGKIGFLSSETPTMSIVDVPNRKLIKTITFSDAVRPMTINHDGSLVYATMEDLDGFEIADVKTGKMIKRVELPSEMWKAKWFDPNNHFFGHGNPSHGIGITPDDSEIWVSDEINVAWQVWDNPGDGRNPVYNPSKTVPVTPGVTSSWISMTNDGKLAFTGDGSIIDVKAHKVINTMKDEYGRRLHAVEKDLVLAFKDGKLIETNNQFAVGNPHAYAEAHGLAAETRQ